MYDKLKAHIKRYEGEKRDSNGLHIMYKCPAGFNTIGWGHNLDANGISNNVAEKILEEDVTDAYYDVSLIFQEISSWPESKKIAICDMMFNLGKPTFLKFRKMIAALHKQDWITAGKEAMDSQWYHQTGDRAKAVVALLTEIDTSEY